MNKEEIQRFPNLDFLRILLATEVVIAHVFMLTIPTYNFSAPIMAVPAFLAVSGVVILKSYGESQSFKDFAKKRAMRILPALITSILLILFLFDWRVAVNSTTTWLTAGIYIPNGYTNQALWSLAWEELAYILLAILWSLGAYRKPAIIWAMLLISMALSEITTRAQLSPYTQTIPLLAQAFFLGNLAYLYRNKMHKLGNLAPWVVFTVVILWRFLPLPEGSKTVAPHLLQVFSVIWVGMTGVKLFRLKFPDISYGAYIYHMPILLFITEKLRITDTATVFCLLFIALIPTCLCSWYLIEKPAIRHARKATSASITNTALSSRIW
jgi:peptidoglycan/LPS O-acetylase OafA/YrhL